MMYAIQVENLIKRFNGFYALNHISFSIKENLFVSILGPNGAGKTTLLEILEGLQMPTSGEVSILGLQWNKQNATLLKKKIGLCLQETHFIDKLTVEETFQLFASFHDIEKKRIQEVIERMNLLEKRKELVRTLSGGQKQRLALGVSILHKPKILFLDEPTTGLDPSIRNSIWQILLELRKEYPLTLLLTTHYMEEAEKLSDYIFLMNKGKMIAEGTLKEIYKKFKKKVKLEFQIKAKQDRIIRIENLCRKKNYHFHIEKDKIAKNTFQFTIEISEDLEPIKIIDEWLLFFKRNQIDFRFFEIHKPNLNDIFLTLTGTSLEMYEGVNHEK